MHDLNKLEEERRLLISDYNIRYEGKALLKYELKFANSLKAAIKKLDLQIADLKSQTHIQD